MTLSTYFKSNDVNADAEDLIIEVNALIAAEQLSGAEIDTLMKAFNVGIMGSGETPSKSGRSSLLSKGILCQTCCKLDDYTFSVTYPFGFKVVSAYLAIKDIRSEK